MKLSPARNAGSYPTHFGTGFHAHHYTMKMFWSEGLPPTQLSHTQLGAGWQRGHTAAV
ncbi:hypothetical protein Plhal304r1_c022g0077401 [Plasmopara halstedii]